MIYSAINGKPVGELNYENELIPFFLEKAFFAFMDGGRKGFENQAYDQMDNFSSHLKVKVDDKNVKAFSLNKMPEAEFQKLARYMTQNMVDGFIKQGSEGLRSGIMTNYDLVYGVMRGHKLA